MEFIHIPFVADPEVNEQNTGQARRQAQKVDEKRTAMPFEIAENEEEIVVEHSVRMVNKKKRFKPCAMFLNN